MTAEIIQNGTRYARIDDEGLITRLDGNWPASGQWRITGAVRLNNFGSVVERFTLADVLAGGIQWQHRNGAQRVHLTDLDHGTRRLWGSPSHRVSVHGEDHACAYSFGVHDCVIPAGHDGPHACDDECDLGH